MSVDPNRCLLLQDIVVECAANYCGSQSMHGLSLEILEIDNGKLDLRKISGTTWRHSGVVEIPPSINELSIFALSAGAGCMLGYMIFLNHDLDKIKNDSSGKYLEWEIRLSPSLKVHLSTSCQVSSARFWTLGNTLRTPSLSRKDNDRWKAERLNVLGHRFLATFKISQKEEDICKAIEAYRDAAVDLSVENPRLGRFIMDLSIGYRERYDRFEEGDDLQEAITMGQAAIMTTAEEHDEFPLLLNDLANSFLRRFERTQDLDDISSAIENQQRVVRLTPDRDVNLPSRLNNLGNSFLRRFKRTGHLDDVANAIKSQRRAVRLTPKSHPDLPSRLNNLGSSFSRRFERTEDLDDIACAIQNQQLAVQLTRDGHRDLPSRLNNLGRSFLCRNQNKCSGSLVSTL